VSLNAHNPSAAIPVWTAPPPSAAVSHLNAAGSTLIKTGAGALASINVNTSSAGALTIRDGVDATGAVLGIVDTTARGFIPAPWSFSTGLYVTQAGTADVTMVSV
jgi:hypothetical protein